MNTDYLNTEAEQTMKQISLSTFDNTQLRTKIYEDSKAKSSDWSTQEIRVSGWVMGYIVGPIK